jgi:hypothetical protein
MKTNNKQLWIAGIIAIVLYLLVSNLGNGEKSEYQKMQDKKEAAYNALNYSKDGNFLILHNTYLVHSEYKNNISAYIKHNSTLKKSFLFLKVTCQANAKRTKTITFTSNTGYEKLNYVNEAYSLTDNKIGDKRFATLDIQIGELLKDQLWRMSQDSTSSIIFTDHRGEHNFKLTEAERQGLEQIILAYKYIRCE